MKVAPLTWTVYSLFIRFQYNGLRTSHRIYYKLTRLKLINTECCFVPSHTLLRTDWFTSALLAPPRMTLTSLVNADLVQMGSRRVWDLTTKSNDLRKIPRSEQRYSPLFLYIGYIIANLKKLFSNRLTFTSVLLINLKILRFRIILRLLIFLVVLIRP